MSKHGVKLSKLGAKTSLCVLAATGFAYSYGGDSASDFLNGFLRSSRAIFAITSCVVDYKYSLFGLAADSDDYRSSLSEIHLRSARRIVKLCDTNKGFYVKAGQFVAAMRQVPKEYSSTLSSLHDQAVPCSFEAIKEVIVDSMGKDLSDIFLCFDERPIAAASIAQVHRAFLKDQQEVAVKVQYPGLEQKMKFDLWTMAILSKSVAWLFPEYRFEWMVSEFSKSITCELDFIHEAKNSEKAANNLKGHRMVKIPPVHWEFTSSKVLTMQFCKGQRVDDLEYMRKMKISPLEVARELSEVFAEMIFVHGFLHGDPHPGNILVSPEGRGGFCLVILDHGIYKQFDEDFRKSYCDLWKALILMDSEKIQHVGEAFGVGRYAKFFPVIFTGRTINSKSAIGRGMTPEERKHLKEELKSLQMEDISSFMESLPPDFPTVLRTDGLLRSLISKLGAPQRIRLLCYAKCALRGLSQEAIIHRSDPSLLLLSRFKTNVEYAQLRLYLGIMECVAYLNDIRLSLTTKLRSFILSIRDRNLSSLLLLR